MTLKTPYPYIFAALLTDFSKAFDWLNHELLTVKLNACDSNKIQTHNHLAGKQTLNHSAKLTKWFSCVVSTYLYGAFDSMLLSCHVGVSERIYTL